MPSTEQALHKYYFIFDDDDVNDRLVMLTEKQNQKTWVLASGYPLNPCENLERFHMLSKLSFPVCKTEADEAMASQWLLALKNLSS